MQGQITKFPDEKGIRPLIDPIAGAAIEQMLKEENAADAAAHAAARSEDPARLRASDVYKCARQLGFRMTKTPKDFELDAKAMMTFRTGDFFHEIVQRALIRHMNARTEVEFDLRPKFSLYGKADGVYAEIGTEKITGDPAYDEACGETVAVEIKSQSGFGFDMATGTRKSAEGPGPKIDHLIQGGFAAVSPQINASKVHVIYVNKDRGVVAEWLLGLDEPLAHLEGKTIRQLVNAEASRLRGVITDLDAERLPARDVPGVGLVQTPARPNSRDKPWQCRFCAWQPTCAALPVGSVPLDLVNKEKAA